MVRILRFEKALMAFLAVVVVGAVVAVALGFGSGKADMENKANLNSRSKSVLSSVMDEYYGWVLETGLYGCSGLDDGTYRVFEDIEEKMRHAVEFYGDSVPLYIDVEGGDQLIYVKNPMMVADSPDDSCYIDIDKGELEVDEYDAHYTGAIYHYPANDVVMSTDPLISCSIEKGKAVIEYEVVHGANKNMTVSEGQCVFIDDGRGIVEKTKVYDEGFSRIEYRIHSLA